MSLKYWFIGTLASILVVFSNDIKILFSDLKTKKNQSYIFLLFLASLPAAIAGIWFKDYFELFFDDYFIVSKALLFTGLILISSYFSNLEIKNIILFHQY